MHNLKSVLLLRVTAMLRQIEVKFSKFLVS